MKAPLNKQQTQRSFTSKHSSQFIRLMTVLLITALLTPIVYFGGWQKVSANSSVPIANTPALISTLREAFVSASSRLSNTVVSSVMNANQSLTNGYRSIVDSIISPAPPEGFAMATVPTVLENASGLLSSFVSAHISPILFSSTAAAAAPAAPLLSAPGSVKFDFDGATAGTAEVSSWQRSTGVWKVKVASSGSVFTASLPTSATTVIAPADYDGDGKTDRAVFNASTGTWTILQSSNDQTVPINGFGQAGDKPVSGDYDGDGKADAALWRPSNGTWYVRQSGSGNQIASQAFGASTDVPVPGNYDGDARMDYALFRPTDGGHWHVLASSTGAYTFYQWGIGTDTPAPADYNGDGKTDYAVYRPSTGTWYAQDSGTSGAFRSKVWGNYGDQPVPADYDGDGKDDFAVWRPTTGVWYIVKSSDPTFNTYEYQSLGMAGDTAVESAYLKQIGGEVIGYPSARARLSPRNQTGGTNLYSRNFGWGKGLVGLPGRAGLDAGFGISYNSLIWTRVNDTVVFDADNSNVAPGFRFGFPTIEPAYYDQLTGTFAYLMIAPSGARVEFKQTMARGASDTYETTDSSYLQLKTYGASNPNDPVENVSILVRGTDGTMMSFDWKAGAFRLNQIKDRNGNIISIVHDDYGRLQTVTDTLGRVTKVYYDSQHYPTSITQMRQPNNGVTAAAQEQTMATFAYTNHPFNPSFQSTLAVFGPAGGAYVKVLEKITGPIVSGTSVGGYTKFEYNAFGQVKKVTNYAANNSELNYTETDLDTPGANLSECPRFTETRNYVKDFNGNVPVIVRNDFVENTTFTGGGGQVGAADLIEAWVVGAPHNVKSRTWYHRPGNWSEGLPFGTEDLAGGVQKRWTRTVWTQDDPTLVYKNNPRVIESKVGDETASVKGTTIEYYQQGELTQTTLYGLVKEVEIFDTDPLNVLKRSVTEYNSNPVYINQRIIGLPSKTELYDGNNQLQSKVTYGYDEFDFNGAGLEQIIDPIQQDRFNYPSSYYFGRANLTSTTRHDVINSTTVSTQTKYNMAGAPVAQIDPLGRTVKISYADSFNDGGNARKTFAYPTKITEVANTDVANNYSTVKYRFDTGANVQAQSPVPAGQATGTLGKITKRTFDTVGRLEKESVLKNNVEHAYTRYDYPTNQTESKVFTTAANGAGEVASESKTDGAGRTIESRTELPSSLGWSGVKTEYDILGRVKRQTVPTEINSNWDTASGDDFRGYVSPGNPIFLWTSQDYDWKGRVIKQTNTDGTFKSFSYAGCGCAGGQVTTVQGEEIFETDWQGNNPVSLGRRTQKIYEDVLGRTVKTEIMSWNGTGAPYLTTVTEYNGRDQAVSVTRTDSGTPPVSQVTTLEYDGHGRLETQHRPEQDAGKVTTYNYNADDSIESVVDAREAKINYVYNARGLLQQVYYSRPAGSSIQIPATVNFTYDALGNRLSMTETTNPAGGISGLGGTTYAYDALSRLKSETRTINDPATGINQSFTFNYEYNLAGQLTEFSDPNDTPRSISYARDKIGRVTAVKNNQPNRFANVEDYATNIQYRAFGAVKSLSYGTVGTGKNLTQTFNDRLQLDEFSVSGGSTTDDDLASKNKYYADGRIKSAGSLTGNTYENKFDRLYKYDHLGRIIEAKSGIEARDASATSTDRPYRQTYDYNAFGNLTNRTGKVWDREPAPLEATYANNRRGNSPHWVYDADGRNTLNDDFHTFYDAAGRRYGTEGDLTITQTFDGDGRRIKQTEQPLGGAVKKRYYVNSSVLGTIYEIEFFSAANWRKKVGLVYLNGQKLAVQSYVTGGAQSVSRLYENPITGSTRGSDPKLGSEPDALGVNAGTTAPPPEPPDYDTGASDLIIPRHADALDLAAGCTIDGAPASCDLVSSMVANGSGIEVMDAIVSTRVTVNGKPVEGETQLYSWSNVPVALGSSFSIAYQDTFAFWGDGTIVPFSNYYRAFDDKPGIRPGTLTSSNGISRDSLPQDSRGGQPPVRHPEREFYKEVRGNNCITNAIEGSRLTKSPNEMIVPGNPPSTGKTPDPSRNDHDGIHILNPLVSSYNVTALQAMEGRVLHYGIQSFTEPLVSVLDIQLNISLNGDPLVLTIKDMDWKRGAFRAEDKIKAGQVLGVARSSASGWVGAVESTGIHVTLMTLSTYNRHIVRGGRSSAARRSVPINKLMDAYNDQNSPFKCPY